MARLLLSCDDYVYCHQGRYYARTQEKYDFYQRYLRVFDQLRLTTRCVYEEELGKSRVPLDKDPRIEYVPLPFFQGPAQYAKQYFKFNQILKKITEGCNAAIVRLPSTVAQRVANAVRKSGIPYCVECVYNSEEGWKGHGLSVNKLLWMKIDADMRTTCYNANGVSCVTEHFLQRNYYSKKANSFQEHYSSLALDSSFYSAARSFPKKPILTIAHVCTQVQFNGRKGYNEVISAIKILKDKGIDVQVRFAGPDYKNGISLLTDLAQQLGVEDRVFFIGGVTRERLSSYLDESDLYVMPTRAEGLPRVIIEAMAKGLPCITTPVSGNPELVSDHFLVEYSDVNTLADRIEELVKDKDIYERESKENFEKSLHYEASVLEKRRDEFYQKLLSCCK